jgi:hypothetical protein
MRKYWLTALTAGAMTAGTLTLAGAAAAAPTGPSDVEQTVKTLEASGYNVIMNRSGGAPLSSCTVKSVRPGQTHRTLDTRGGSDITETIVSKTVYVDLAC